MNVYTYTHSLSLTFTYTHACFDAYFMYLYVTTTAAAAAAATTTHINGTGYRVIRYIIRFILCDTERLTQLLSVKSRMREEEEEATVKKVYVNACVRTNTSVQVVPQFAVCVILSVSYFTFLRRSIAAAVAVAVCTSRMGNSTVVNSY